MQVFKLSLKLMKKKMPSLILYIVLAIILSMVMSFSYKGDYGNTFNETKAKALFVNNDKDGILSEGLKEHLEKYCEFITLSNEKSSIQDALFFREISIAIVIPEGFSEDILNGRKPIIEKASVPNAYDSVYAEMALKKYLRAAEVYISNEPSMTEADLVENLQKDFESNIKVILSDTGVKTKKTFIKTYFNFAMYAITAIMISGVGSLMLIFFDKEIKGRNTVAPITGFRFNLQLMAGNFVFALLVLISIILAGFVLNGGANDIMHSLLYVFNLCIYTLVAFSISYFISLFVKDSTAIAAISTIVSLFFSFISGVFVPVYLLGDTVLKVGSFTPAYWYVRANEKINMLTSFQYKDLEPVLQCILIELAFAAALIAASLVASKVRSNYETA